MSRTVVGVVVVAILGSLVAAESARADEACPTYFLIGARGTDEEPRVQTESEYQGDEYEGTGILADRIFTTLEPIVVANGGTIGRYGVRYAADMDLGGFATEVANAQYNWTFENEWDAGVAVGTTDAVSTIESTYAACPGTKYILVGYSQGADVVGETIDELSPTLRSRIAATALFGDPRFNPNDATANTGGYLGDRSGMFGTRPLWATKLSSPVFSYCLWMDFACQSRIYAGASLQPMSWPLGAAFGYFGDALGSHPDYQRPGQMEAKGVAFDIASALSLTFTYDDTAAVDVVFLIDSTPNAAEAVTELKTRAEDLTDVVSDANGNSRFAVVDYKGTDAGNPYVAHVAQDFTTDPADVDDAIDALAVSGGNTSPMWWLPQSASGYSGVLEATDLEWRDYARKLVVLLSASRVNADDPWGGDEEVTLISAADVDDALASEWDRRLYGVAFGDDWGVQEWVSTAAHHSGGTYRSVGSGESAVDAMLLMADEGLRRIDLSLTGPTLAKPGETLSFSASTRNIVDDSDVTYIWSVCEVSDEPIIVSRSVVVVTDASTCGVSPPIPGDEAEDEGSTAEFEFTETGLYRVGVSARVDPSDDPYWLGDPQLYWS